MSTVTQPRNGVPIGTALFNGREIDVFPTAEYLRMFFDLVKRAGGATGISSAEIEFIAQQALQLAAFTLQDQQTQVIAGDGVTVNRWAGGFQVLADPLWTAGVSDPAPFNVTPPNDLQAVLAAQVFA